jgi:hypothetical protein
MARASESASHGFQISIGMHIQQSIDVLHVLRPVCDRSHDEQIFDPRQPDGHAVDFMNEAPVDRVVLKRQTAKNQVDVDGGCRVPQQEHTRATRKLQCVLNSRNDPVSEGVYVLRVARSTEK